jgi:hypothetical protein
MMLHWIRAVGRAADTLLQMGCLYVALCCCSCRVTGIELVCSFASSHELRCRGRSGVHCTTRKLHCSTKQSGFAPGLGWECAVKMALHFWSLCDGLVSVLRTSEWCGGLVCPVRLAALNIVVPALCLLVSAAPRRVRGSAAIHVCHYATAACPAALSPS